MKMTVSRVIIGQSGGPTPVIDAELAGFLDVMNSKRVEVLGSSNGLEGIFYADTVPGNKVDLSGTDPIALLHNGPGSALRTTRFKPSDEYSTIVDVLHRLKVDGIAYIGGNDSANQLLDLTKEDVALRAIHLIKTVDNDLPITHHCPGWGSASLFNAKAIKRVCSDFFSYQVDASSGRYEKAPVAIYQVMGRNAGWLAQATAFARVDPSGEMIEGRPPHIILCKEVLFNKEDFLNKMDDVLTKYGHACVVVQEDLDDAKTGQSLSKLYSQDEDDDHGNIEHGRPDSFSTAIYLAQIVKSELQVDAVDKTKEAAFAPQHIQRSYEASLTDVAEAYLLGKDAAIAMLDGATGKSVIFEKNKEGRIVTGLTDLTNIAAKVRQVHMRYIDGIKGPTQKFVDEFIPYIGGPMAIPHYSQMRYPVVEVPR